MKYEEMSGHVYRIGTVHTVEVSTPLIFFSAPCRMVETVVQQLGGLHIAVNNAGINKNAAAEDTTEQDWDLTFDINTKGVFLCCQVCLVV